MYARASCDGASGTRPERDSGPGSHSWSNRRSGSRSEQMEVQVNQHGGNIRTRSSAEPSSSTDSDCLPDRKCSLSGLTNQASANSSLWFPLKKLKADVVRPRTAIDESETFTVNTAQILHRVQYKYCTKYCTNTEQGKANILYYLR